MVARKIELNMALPEFHPGKIFAKRPAGARIELILQIPVEPGF